ncbi:unnamed protein product [Rotaria sordida]|nr:unnamed protein product [Rotaria sordida]
MKRRLDQYLSSTNSVQKSKSDISNQSFHEHDTHSSPPIDSNETIHRSYSNSNQYRPLVDQINKHNYPTNHLLTSNTQQQPIQTNISRSQSREDISNLRNELSTKHAKHVSDLKLYYEHEIDELKNQLNISRMGHPNSSTTRQSIETIERINNENIRLHDHIKQLRQSLKTSDEENNSLKRQLEELRGQINNKDVEIKNSHKKLNEMEQELNEIRHMKDQQNEKYAYIDRQSLFYQEEYQKISRDLILTRERLARLEESYRQLENQHKTCRQQTFTNENNNQRINHDTNYNSAMSLNIPTSREYGRFTLIQSKYSSATITKSRDENIDSGTYTSDGSDDLFRHSNSRRPVDNISDFVSEQDCFPHVHVQSSRPFYSSNKLSPNGHRSIDQMPVRDFSDNKIKESEKLESKFDELLNKKRDLESRINRIPIRGLTTTDRQLLDVLEREIQRVEQQISSVKLELRKMNILPTY